MKRTPLRPSSDPHLILKRGGPKRRKRIRSRSFTEKMGDDPLRYGVVWLAVRVLPCFAGLLDASHRCGGPGRHTAHHEGPDDLAGLLPCCGYVHRGLEGSINRTRSEYLEELGLTEDKIYILAREYVTDVLEDLGIDPELPRDEIAAALLELPDAGSLD